MNETLNEGRIPEAVAAQLRENFKNIQDHLDGLLAGQAVGLADTETILLLCKHISEQAGIEKIEGLSIVEWYGREKLRRLERIMFDLEDSSPARAASLQRQFDELKRKYGINLEPQ